MARKFVGVEWELPLTKEGRLQAWEYAGYAILMDIRDELKTLNRLLHCPNFTGIPGTLKTIEKQTKKKPRSKRKGIL